MSSRNNAGQQLVVSGLIKIGRGFVILKIRGSVGSIRSVHFDLLNRDLANEFPGRTAHAIRLHYQKNIKVQNETFTPEEVFVVYHLMPSDL
jgi:hypothetical protein